MFIVLLNERLTQINFKAIFVTVLTDGFPYREVILGLLDNIESSVI